MIRICLPGDPTAQARLRMFRRGNKSMVYDPQTAYKNSLKHLVRDQLQEMPQ